MPETTIGSLASDPLHDSFEDYGTSITTLPNPPPWAPSSPPAQPADCESHGHRARCKWNAYCDDCHRNCRTAYLLDCFGRLLIGGGGYSQGCGHYRRDYHFVQRRSDFDCRVCAITGRLSLHRVVSDCRQRELQSLQQHGKPNYPRGCDVELECEALRSTLVLILRASRHRTECIGR